MKKVILVTIISFSLHSISEAQISKGSVLLGGGVSIGKLKSDKSIPSSPDNDQKYLSVNPAVGIAIKENLIFGVQLSYGNSENTHLYPSLELQENDYSTYGGGIFLRQYLVLGKGFYAFGQGDLSYRHQENTNNYISPNVSNSSSFKDKGWNIGLNLSPGISYAVNKRFHLEVGFSNLLGFNLSKSRIYYVSNGNQYNQEKTGFGFNTNASNLSGYNVGFRFLFAK
jgi:hypothetical protein